jgi:hypothetical protein
MGVPMKIAYVYDALSRKVDTKYAGLCISTLINIHIIYNGEC